jgi:putative addiction module component (TIGR02574 family)
MSTLLDEIQQLGIAERIQLVEDLWDSVVPHVKFSDHRCAKVELDRRLAKRASVKPSVSLDQIAQNSASPYEFVGHI